MPAGEAFSARDRDEILRALGLAEQASGLPMSVYVGELGGDPRARAEALHAEVDPRAAVLVAVDPGARRLEIVTGPQARLHLDDRACALAAASMTSAFAAGDLAGGISTGVRMLGEHARAPRTLNREAY